MQKAKIELGEELDGGNVVLRFMPVGAMPTVPRFKRYLEELFQGVEFNRDERKPLELVMVEGVAQAAVAGNRSGIFVITTERFASELKKQLDGIYSIEDF